MLRPARALLVFALALTGAAFAPACSGGDSDESTPIDTDTGVDVPEFEEPTFDADDPAGRVLILPIYFPDKRCFDPATEIGKLPAGPDGAIADCKKQEVCYVRPDGVLAYHDQDCIQPGDFRANWKRYDYSDLGPCEPIKHAFSLIKSCPNPSCIWARDAVIDTAAGCATALTTKGCRDAFGTATKCWCNGTSVFLPADPKSSATPPPSYTPCDGSAACTKAMLMVDTVKGCEIASDAGTDAASDTSSDAASDASSDVASDASSGG